MLTSVSLCLLCYLSTFVYRFDQWCRPKEAALNKTKIKNRKSQFIAVCTGELHYREIHLGKKAAKCITCWKTEQTKLIIPLKILWQDLWKPCWDCFVLFCFVFSISFRFVSFHFVLHFGFCFLATSYKWRLLFVLLSRYFLKIDEGLFFTHKYTHRFK